MLAGSRTGPGVREACDREGNLVPWTKWPILGICRREEALLRDLWAMPGYSLHMVSQGEVVNQRLKEAFVPEVKWGSRDL